MPDFVGTYELAGDPPEKWEEELRRLASSFGIELRSTLRVRLRIIITVRVPKSATAPARESAVAFLEDAASVLSGSAGHGYAQLTNTSTVRSRTERLESIFSAIGLPLGIGLAGIALLLSKSSPPALMAGVSTAAALVTAIGIFFSFRDARNEYSAIFEKARRAVQERALVKQVAGGEDPKQLARIELARVSLRIRASSMRGDADRLWKRSIWAYRGAFLFFLLAIAGPGVAAVLVLNSPIPDWRFMFGGLSLSAVPLGIGTALLRHDTKLREQYQESARDVALLERYELALDYARISSLNSYQATLQQVIAQLLSNRTDNLAQPPMIGDKEPEKEGGSEELPSIQKLVTVAVDATKDVVTSITPKKGG